ncbi:hypothetical protein C5B42_00450 [Candidatus Cerribacteria bacterium 'Amazon FNV 2010 28 9']|uniref:Uncharacterized protein n=1 Tax=Candidatus Cerribacteria bacterium 'Amazon FNV 2010 28 9' TaxID=2081795 RepID=A0A317JRJ8_9BACT|nr:MAG: hypothetical protein C5B42_00450 [Candidatus Cerribacteria bacterium 'Amazon FNV 2010 28 9']
MSNLIERGVRQDDAEQHEVALPIEWPDRDIEIADAEVTQAARAIRLYYYRQLPLLRMIPYLALEANGRGGWLDEYSRAYGSCVMAIHQENETWGSYDMFIELRSGVLIGAKASSNHYVITTTETVEFGGDVTLSMASDKEVYTKLAHQSGDVRFSPADEISYMRKMIQKPYHNNPQEVESALRDKAEYKKELDVMMAALPLEQVIAILRSQGFDV